MHITLLFSEKSFKKGTMFSFLFICVFICFAFSYSTFTWIYVSSFSKRSITIVHTKYNIHNKQCVGSMESRKSNFYSKHSSHFQKQENLLTSYSFALNLQILYYWKKKLRNSLILGPLNTHSPLFFISALRHAVSPRDMHTFIDIKWRSLYS